MMRVRKLVLGVETKPPDFFQNFFMMCYPFTRDYMIFIDYILSLRGGFLLGLRKLTFDVETLFLAFLFDLKKIIVKFIVNSILNTNISLASCWKNVAIEPASLNCPQNCTRAGMMFSIRKTFCIQICSSCCIVSTVAVHYDHINVFRRIVCRSHFKLTRNQLIIYGIIMKNNKW